MRHSRRLALLAPLVLIAACARPDSPPSPATRFSAVLEASDPAVDSSIAVMDSFERRAMREERAVGFALGRNPAAPPQAALPATGAVEAAGEVIAPAFTALGDYGHVLNDAATGDRPEPRPSVGPEVLAQGLAQALPTVSATIAPPVREAGIAGVTALARIAQDAPERGRVSAQALAQEAQPHLLAVTTLLKAVIGAQQGQATRGVVRSRRDAMEAAHVRLLEAARRDPGLGAAGRYALFHQVAALRDQDPLPGTLAAIVALLSAMEEAHAAIAAGDTAADGKVAAFEAALAQLTALTGQDQGQAQEQ